MTDPRLIGWAVHPPDIAALAMRLRENKVEFTGPSDGSRKTPGRPSPQLENHQPR